MPASEQVWRTPKLMHFIFGVTSVLMLISTVWMLADDHAKEWKTFQLQDREIEQWTLNARLNLEDKVLSAGALAERENALALARSALIDDEALERYKQEVRDDAERLGVETPGFKELEQKHETLVPLVEQVKQARVASSESHNKWADVLRAVNEAATGDEEFLREQKESAKDALVNARKGKVKLAEAERAAAKARNRVLDDLRDTARVAKLRESNLSQDAKFKKADLTAEVSKHGLAIGVGKSDEEVAGIQLTLDDLKGEVDALVADLDAAKDHRLALEEIIKEITAEEDLAVKLLTESQAEFNRLQATRDERSANWREWIVRQPVLDAFYTGESLKIDQIWLPDVTIDYNFSDVGRFDRCITCHRSIDKSAAGSAVQPANVLEQTLTVILNTPDEEPRPEIDEEGQENQPSLISVYGIQLADQGRVKRSDVTIEYVLPDTNAARAGLQLGDVIEEINDDKIYTQDNVLAYLLGSYTVWGQPVTMSIRRGLPHPYVPHPRLDLYVGSLSPHKKEEMGCTICHDGQGSGTAFKWASHSPNDPKQALDWQRRLGWFDNHHWIFPMYPDRFIESGCLKCHHEVTELASSERFPEPPAPKLVKGFHLIQKFGCFGCHEINGYDGPDRRIGPDLRGEPNFFGVAQALLQDDGLNEQERGWAERLVAHPEDGAVRRRLWEAIQVDKESAFGEEEGTTPRFAAYSYELGDLLKDVEAPGKLRKVGPSLRYLAAKVDFRFLYSWIRKPSDFRPTTRMPQFFGLDEHLDGKHPDWNITDAGGDVQPLTDQEFTARYENIEIRAISQYLLGASNPFEYLAPPEDVTEEPSDERGKRLFELRGCLGCHSHQAFPGIHQTQGPELSRAGAKFNTTQGRQWLYTWLKQPSHYHVRTKMPNLFLDPIPLKDAQGKPTGQVTDPAADIVAFLLTSHGMGSKPDAQAKPWEPKDIPDQQLSAEEHRALHDLALDYLSGAFPRRRAEKYLEDGIPAAMGDQLKGAEKTLVGITPQNRTAIQLKYVGQRAIAKYGCAGCHDIPGFETAMPIGTSLAEWGRKESSKLAFELIQQFLVGHGIDGRGGHASGGYGEGHGKTGGGHSHGLNPDDFDPDTGYYLQALAAHRREGFIWQKLRMPRSYDYKKTQNKGYNERLRMPKFPLDKDQAEAIITFVLGLVAEPPAAEYIYDPDPRQRAIVEGRAVLDKYNCVGCHTFKMDRWEFDYHPFISDEDPGDYESPGEGPPDYPFLKTHITAEAVAASLEIDARGLRHAVVHGMPSTSEQDGQPLSVDEEGVPLEEGDEDIEAFYAFELWQPALINGLVRGVGERILVRDQSITKYPSLGGDLTRYLYPIVIAEEQKANPQVKGSEAWGWLPPPLVGEGRKVQSDWLHDFLLDPYRIRPAVVMRMPKFNMSSEEASKIANYFATIDGAEYPYQDDQRQRAGYIAAKQRDHPGYLSDGLKIVVDNNYCVKCHLVGDFHPQGSPTALAPNLELVSRRLRPGFVRNWVANPKRYLPYTGMPVNIPFKDESPNFGGVSQELFHGTSTDQLDAVVDFLMNYSVYASEQMSIRGLVKPAEPNAEARQAVNPLRRTR